MKHAEIIAKMTVEEKAAILSGASEWESREIKRLGIPAAFFSDGPHGVRKQEGEGDHLGLNASVPATCFPTAATIANSWDESLGEEIGKALGEEASALGVDVLLGPGLNIKRSPLCGRNFEYFSEDPYLAGKMAASYVRGIQSQGIYACPKHFAVNSQELRRMAMNSVLDERTLREIYLTGFEIAIKEGKANEDHVEEAKGLAVAMQNFTWFFFQVLFVGGAGGILVQTTLAGLGYEVELIDLAAAEIPVALVALVVSCAFVIVKDNKLMKKYYGKSTDTKK